MSYNVRRCGVCFGFVLNELGFEYLLEGIDGFGCGLIND